MILRFVSVIVVLLLLFGAALPVRAATPTPDPWKSYQLGEFEAAIQAFEEIERTDNDPEARWMAMYGQAHCWNYRTSGRDAAKATALYQAVIDQAPEGHPLPPWCAFEMAQIDHVTQPAEGRDLAAIAARYKAVYDRYPDSEAGQEAWVNAEMLLASGRIGEPKEAVARAEAFLERHPKTVWRARVHQLQVLLYRNANDPARQVEQLLIAAKHRQANAVSGVLDNSTLYWEVATLAEFRLGDFTLARDYYGRFLKEYPRDNRAFGAQKALERMDRVEKQLREGLATPPSSF